MRESVLLCLIRENCLCYLFSDEAHPRVRPGGSPGNLTLNPTPPPRPPIKDRKTGELADTADCYFNVEMAMWPTCVRAANPRTKTLHFRGFWHKEKLNLHGWASQAHRGFPGKFDLTNLSRDNLSRENVPRALLICVTAWLIICVVWLGGVCLVRMECPAWCSGGSAAQHSVVQDLAIRFKIA